MASRIPYVIYLDMSDLDLSVRQDDDEISAVTSRLRRMTGVVDDSYGEFTRGIPPPYFILVKGPLVTCTPAPPTPPLPKQSSTTMPSVQTPIIIIPKTYSGQANFKDWFTQFNQCKQMNGWT